jgi:hypothetical protein
MTAEWKKSENVSYTYNNFNVTGLTICTLQFTTQQNLSAPVRAYYHLDNFYQNHRRYVNSFYADQLLGKKVDTSTLKNSNCAPLAVEGDKQIYPCGLIANSLFNDTIGPPVFLGGRNATGGSTTTYNWSEKDIAWKADMDLYKPLDDPDYDLIVPPPNWRVRYPEGKYSTDFPPDFTTNEHFISWMRTAALPSFFKPWAFGNETLVAGTYQIEIVDSKYILWFALV